MEAINVALLGLGTIGSGVYELMTSRSAEIEHKTGIPIRISKILEKDLTRAKAMGIFVDMIASGIDEILDDPDISIVIELIGGIEPAREWILKAIDSGKMVVTANKELLAKHGEEIFNASSEKKVEVLFEASVGGGIPLIRPLKESLAVNHFSRITGIVNGTTNYILTKMSEKLTSFDEALSEAQRLGYAEANPEADVEGFDAASKIAILSCIAFHSRVSSDQVYTEGISRIQPRDIVYADEMGYVVKLLAIGEELESGISARVHPAMIKKNHPLASVKDEFNAILVEGDAVGEVMFYGAGAGKMPTASAVIGDVMEASRCLISGRKMKIGCTCYEEKPILPVENLKSKFYLLLRAADKPGVLAQVAKVFGENGVSLESVLQKFRGEVADIVFITHEVEERYFFKALTEIDGLDVVEEECNYIRVLDGE